MRARENDSLLYEDVSKQDVVPTRRRATGGRFGRAAERMGAASGSAMCL